MLRIGVLLNARYLYEPDSGSDSVVGKGRSAKADLISSALAKIPSELLQSLRESAENADYFQLMALIEQVRDYSSPMAEELRNLVQSYNYDACIDLLAQCNEA